MDKITIKISKSRILFEFLILFMLLTLMSYSIVKVFNLLNTSQNTSGIILLSFIILLYIIIDKKLNKGHYIIFIIPLIIIISGNSDALLAVLIFSSASISLGLSVYKYFVPLDININTIVSSLFIGMSINSYLIWIAMHFKVNIPCVYYLFFFLEIFIFRKYLEISMLKIKVNKINITYAQKVILLSAIYTLPYVIVPFYLCDDIIKHLYIPKYVYINRCYDFNPNFIFSLDTGIIGQSSYTAVFLLGQEYAVRLLNYSVFYAGFLLIEYFTKKIFDKKVALFTILTAVSTPFLLWQIGVVFTDSFAFTSAIVLFIYSFEINNDISNKKKLLLYFLISVFSYLCKQQAIFIIIPTGLIIGHKAIKKIFREKEYAIIYNLIIGLLLFCLILAPLLLQNYILTGNPLFPFYNGIFKSEWFVKENFKDHRWQHQLNWKTIYDITFNGNKYIENMNYSFGFSYFVFFSFIPLIFINRDKRKEIFLVCSIFILSILLWFNITGPYMRYFISCLPTGSIIIGLIISKILDIITNRIIYWATISICIITFLLNMYCQTNIVNITTPYPLMECLTHNLKNSNLAYSQDIKKVFDFVSVKYGKKAKCLLINSHYMYFADFEIENLSWHYYKTQQDILSSSNNAGDLYDKIFIKHKFNFIIIPDNCPDPFRPDIFNEFHKMLVNEFTAGGYVLYSPQKNTYTTYDFCQHFQEANIYGNESIGAPWGKSITPLTINELNNKSAIFCAPSPVSKLEYNILINNNSILNTSIGFHPASKNFNVSDGVRMKIEVNDGRTDYVILNQYVMPEDNFIEKKMPLYQFTGKEIKIKFITSNDNGKNANGDWPIWLEPQIISNSLVD